MTFANGSSVTGITKTTVGLNNVDNTTDNDKPVSTLTTQALNLKAPIASPSFTGAVSFVGATSVTGLNKNTVGLNNVDNTSDENKPVSALTAQALNGKQNTLSSTTDVTTGVGTFKCIACTATSGRPLTPSGYGAYLGCDGTIFAHSNYLATTCHT